MITIIKRVLITTLKGNRVVQGQKGGGCQMADIKIRCPWCDALMDFIADGSLFECGACSSMFSPPPGADLADPYADWRSCYNEDLHRRRQDKPNSSSRSGKRKQRKKLTPALFVDRYKLL